MIVQHVSREKHPRNLHHVVRFGDIEAAVPVGERQSVYLSVQFTGSVVSGPPEYRQSQRSGRTKAGVGGVEYVQLAQVSFHPLAERVIEPDGCPWNGVVDPIVVFAEIYPIERKVSEWFPKLRAALAEVLLARIGELARGGLPSERWMLHIGFLPESGSLEVGITTWTDLRKNDERVDQFKV